MNTTFAKKTPNFAKPLNPLKNLGSRQTYGKSNISDEISILNTIANIHINHKEYSYAIDSYKKILKIYLSNNFHYLKIINIKNNINYLQLILKINNLNSEQKTLKNNVLILESTNSLSKFSKSKLYQQLISTDHKGFFIVPDEQLDQYLNSDEQFELISQIRRITHINHSISLLYYQLGKYQSK